MSLVPASITRPALRLAVVAFGALLLAACAGGIDYSRLHSQLRSGDCEAALSDLSRAEDDYGRNRLLIYHMDVGMINLLCGHHEESAESFVRKGRRS